MSGLRIVDVPTAAPRDPQRATVRYLPLAAFRGLPVPGEPVELRMPHTRQTIPGSIYFVHWLDGVVAVEPDHQTIHGTR
jgi:hypothetical protein